MTPARILIIDDDELICKSCFKALAGQNHTVDVCSTGRAGLNALMAGGYDVILLAMRLPDIPGMEILRTVEKERPDLQVIVITGYETVKNAVESMKHGAFDYLPKPFTRDEIVRAVDKAIAKKRIIDENRSLRELPAFRPSFGDIVGNNPLIIKVFQKIEKVAPTDSTVLIVGESGTGKELFARAIYARSRRSSRRFVAVDCSTLHSGLLESELFGHVRGAFTGAVEDKTGIFELAHRGTLFLDDVANLDPEIQSKLLRVLESSEYKPVGSSRFKMSDARIIAATNRDLKYLVDHGEFRGDLFYRLNVFPVFLPPLRKRKDDIPRLSYHFLKHFCKKTGKRISGFSDDAMELLVNQEWPGNVRQLKNVIERLVIMSDTGVLDLLHLMENLQTKLPWESDSTPESLEELKKFKKRFLEKSFHHIEKAFLTKALTASGGNITRAAQRVGMQRSNFSALMKKHGIKSPEKKSLE